MKIVSEIFEDVCVITLTGELDSRANLLLDKSLRDLAHAGNYKMVLDVSAIRFMGNQTVSILLKNLKEYRAGGGDIKFLNPQRAVLQYLKSNRMFELFQIFSSRTEAVSSFKEAVPPGKNTVEASVPLNPSGSQPVSVSSTELSSGDLESRFATGEILYANSCMIATLIKTLEQKGVISSQEALELLNTEQLPLKGETE